MNNKQRDFLISNIIIVIFTVLLVLILNNFLTIQFGFNKDTFFPITFVLLLFSAILYYFLSNQLLQPLFRSEKEIQSLIKETLHEINTPVATIQMNTKLLQKKEQDIKNIDRLNRIEHSCDNLLNLYNQMEYSIKEQIDNVSIEVFDIDEVVLKSCDKFIDIKKDIELKYISSSLTINTDKNGFEKVIDNLISNAIKYNKPNGKITISIDGSILKISDTGIGIDTKNLFHIFDKYYQENSLSNGVGLGLNIIKSYCDKYKIDLKIDSQIDIGTVFYLDLKGLVK
ncbi:MAG: HAMP domain-containing sensor histidine kinase [Campylobacterota bacterium]|nr:HAMP domain-containing sensor histidine kinase [Campylobacterota bacterium]